MEDVLTPQVREVLGLDGDQDGQVLPPAGVLDKLVYGVGLPDGEARESADPIDYRSNLRIDRGEDLLLESSPPLALEAPRRSRADEQRLRDGRRQARLSGAEGVRSHGDDIALRQVGPGHHQEAGRRVDA